MKSRENGKSRMMAGLGNIETEFLFQVGNSNTKPEDVEHAGK